MKKFYIILISILLLLATIFAEYRFIMHNIKPYTDDNGTLYLEVFGMIDQYYAEPIN